MAERDCEDAEARKGLAVQTQRLDDHERFCGERWDDNKRKMQELKSRQNWTLGVMVSGLIAVLVSVLTLAVKTGAAP